MRKMVLSLLVHNRAGVTSRIAGLFSRRGYNMDSITGGVTENPDITRVTVVVHGEEAVLEQVTKQLSKLEDVIEIEEFRANVVDVAKNSLMIELTGDASKLDAFLELLTGYEILGIARTGLTGLCRGSAVKK